MIRLLMIAALAAAPAIAQEPGIVQDGPDAPQVGQQVDEPLDPFFLTEGAPETREGDDPVAGELNPIRDWNLTEGRDDRIDTHPSDTITLPRPSPAFVIDFD